ncbi:hypothetical protein ACFL6U_21230 [Planctomycetota bacterium]
MLLLSLTLIVPGCSKKKESKDVQDINSVRAGLREQVASGKLTHEEAIVRLAEATKEAKLGTRKKGKRKDKELSPELDALGKELKERMAKGELTDEEAKAAWIQAAKEAKGKSGAKAPKDSAKRKE